jgi:putative membrane protein
MKNRLTIIAAIAVGSFCLTGAATAQNPRPYPPLRGAGSPAAEKAKKGSALSAKDKTFMMNAAKGGMMEVQWGKMAAQDGKSAEVKKFGNRMVTDHSKANNELMGLAKEEGVTLPSEKASGKWKSDKDYMDMMVKDHEKDLAEFQAEAKNGSDPDLKQFADKYAKMVQKHLDLAKETQGKLK